MTGPYGAISGSTGRRLSSEDWRSTPNKKNITDRASGDTLYLSANGMLYPDCNLSYQNLDYAVTSPADCPVQSIPVNDDMKQAILAMLP